MPVLIQNLQNKIPLGRKMEEMLERVVETILVQEGIVPEGEVGVVLVDDEYIRRLNAQYRHIDCPTDVLSFPQLEPGVEEQLQGEEPLLLGDIVISMERVQAQAKEYGHSLERELAYLAAHGMLHLLGWDHDTEIRRGEMRLQEERVLEVLDLTREG